MDGGYVPTDAGESASAKTIGFPPDPYVIVRCDRSGVFAGTITHWRERPEYPTEGI